MCRIGAGRSASPARLVITVHDVIPLSMPVYQGGIGARLYFSLVSATARGAAHLITDSEFSRDEIVQRIGVPAERVTAIPLACGPEFHPRLGRRARCGDPREVQPARRRLHPLPGRL